MPDTTPTLRDRIRRAICEASGFTWLPDELMEPDEYGEHADAVLAALPEPPVRLVSGTTDQQPTTTPAGRAAVLREASNVAHGEASRLYDDMGQRAAAGARMVGARLERMADEAQQPDAAGCKRCGCSPRCCACDFDEAQPATDQTTVHRCNNCEGIDPDTCFNNPHRPPEQCPAAEFEDYGQQCQKPVGHELHTFEEQPAATDQPTEAEAACSRCLHVPHPGLCQHFAGTAGACQCTVADRPDTETEATK